MNTNRGNMWGLAVALFVIVALVANQAEGFLTLLILGALLFLVRMFESGNRPAFSERRRATPRPIPSTDRQPHSKPVYEHALEAVAAAGLDPDAIPVLPVDIGLMAFKNSTDPVVHRTLSVPNDVDYIQPFVQLRLPTKATGKVRFELIDRTGEVVFVHEDIHQLKRGRNLVTPSARLPVHDVHQTDGEWYLRITADGVTIAVHHFEWIEGSTGAVRRHMGSDGELSSEMRAVLAESRLEKMSLDDMLAYQEDEGEQQQR
jgi:hypothetical protein